MTAKCPECERPWRKKMSAKKPKASPKPKNTNVILGLVLVLWAALKWPVWQVARLWTWLPYKTAMIMLMAILALGAVSWKLMEHRDAVIHKLAYNEGFEEGKKKSVVIVKTVTVEKAPVVEAQPAAPAAPAPEPKKQKPKPAKTESFGDGVRKFFNL